MSFPHQDVISVSETRYAELRSWYPCIGVPFDDVRLHWHNPLVTVRLIETPVSDQDFVAGFGSPKIDNQFTSSPDTIRARLYMYRSASRSQTPSRSRPNQTKLRGLSILPVLPLPTLQCRTPSSTQPFSTGAPQSSSSQPPTRTSPQTSPPCPRPSGSATAAFSA
jgi:hypothetical protein